MANNNIIQIGHSPDPDDVFMVYPLVQGLIETGDIQFKGVPKDIQILNECAKSGQLEVTALSAYGYCHVTDKYILLPFGTSVGRNYGPILVADRPMDADELVHQTIAIPGELTTGYLVSRLILGKYDFRVVPFQEIIPRIKSGEFHAGLIIHEGQLTYSAQGLYKVIDVGEWWNQTYHLPLPLGVNAIRRDLDSGLQKKVAGYIRKGIDYAMEHRDEMLHQAMKFSTAGEDFELSDRFIGMYVNQDSLELADSIRQSFNIIVQQAGKAGLLPQGAKVEILDL